MLDVSNHASKHYIATLVGCEIATFPDSQGQGALTVNELSAFVLHFE
jgi:hypothetical protein